MFEFQLDHIYCGECSEVMSHWPAECVDLVVTSPPYDNLRRYNGYEFNFEAIARQLWRTIKVGGVVVWVVADATIDGSETGTSFRQALYFKELGFNLHDTMIYEIAGTGAKGSNFAYWQSFEYMFVFSNGVPKSINRIADIKNATIGLVRQGRYREGGNSEKAHKTNELGVRTNIWRYNVGFMDKSDKTDHPAVFPEALAKDHIISWSNAGDIVLDPMCGSGTTLKQAKELGRHWIGIDISEEYCQLSQRRVDGARVPFPELTGY